MREKELRLALVCYGGVSLAIYMHGVAKEIWKLARASRAFHDREPQSLTDSERVYHDLLAAMAPAQQTQVIVDIVAGSSAGGVNAVFLAHAIATGADFGALTDLWLTEADVDRLLDPQAAPTSRWSKVYAEPLIWLAGRRYAELFEDVEPHVQDEVRGKLSRLIRSRWFEPPFSGAKFTRDILEAFDAMAAAPPGPALVPPGLPLDLFVTVTDFHGHPERLRLHSPGEVVETEYRLTLGFHDTGQDCARHLGDVAELTLAARATASIPGIFPALQLGEIDRELAARGQAWPGRKAFLARAFPGRVARGEDVGQIALVDGGVLDNAPFGCAIAALKHRPANREVDRRVLFIDPTPGKSAIRLRSSTAPGPPGFFTNIFRSLSDIPREQPIRDSLDALHAISRKAKRLRYVVDGMRPAVEAAIGQAFGPGLALEALTPERLAGLRAGAHTLAARGSGFTYPAYGQLKLSGVVESLAEAFVTLGHHDALPGGAERVRAALWAHVRGEGFTLVDAPGDPEADHVPFVGFLRRFDLNFRIRRLRALIRAMNDFAAAAEEAARPALEAVKLDLYALLAPFLARAALQSVPAPVAETARAADRDPAAALLALGDAWDLRALDAATDAGFVAIVTPLGEAARRALLIAYLGFPFFDIATLPLHQDDGLDEADEIKIDRIAPEDTSFLRPGAGSLKGTRLNSFAAFFARAYRENDYLWGRLHAAERLIDIVLSTLPEDAPPAPGLADRLKVAAMRAVLDDEQPRLSAIADLVAALRFDLERVASNVGQTSSAPIAPPGA